MTPQQLQQHIIDNILPKEKIEDRKVRNSGLWDLAIGYNEAIRNVKALLPKIIEYILKNKE